ncbi:MAG: phenylacetic acid degradation protein PaaY [Desulfobacca sp.]|nr:phenylacetic acid degradation protein PaaY [Desulfobacca sp.]
MAIYRFENKSPLIHQSAYVHPQAAIIGDIEIGAHCFIGAGAVLRGDFGAIRIGPGSCVQDNSVLHVGFTRLLSIAENVIIAHGVILHDVIIKPYVLIGMGSILMAGVSCEDHVMIATGSVVRENFHIPSHSVVAGNPAKIVKPLSEEQKNRILEGVKTYQDLTRRYKKSDG